MEWYYAKEGKQFGPIEFVELQRLAAAGAINAESLVWKKGMAQWTAAGKIDGLLPGAAASASGLEGAGFGIRLLARIIDMIFVAVLGVVAGVFGGILLLALQATGHLSAGWQARMSGLGFFGIASAVIGTLFYHCLCEGLHGSTVGKKLCGLRVVAEGGGLAGIKSALIRTAAFYVDGLFFGLVGYYSMKKSPLRQRLGDKWGKTVVARAADLPESGAGPLGPFFLALAYGSAACAASLTLGLLLKTIR